MIPQAAHSLPRVNVLCMKWGSRYPAYYVNRLAAGVARHLARPHRFVCFTDDTDGLDPAIEAYPLPQLDLPEGPERGWRKLSVFAERLVDLSGTALFLDLDVVITGPLDGFFELPGSFRIIRDWNRAFASTGNSSVFRFEIGAHPQLLGYFNANANWVTGGYRTEQRFLSDYMAQRHLLEFWPEGWCASYKTDCIPMWPLGYFLEPTPPPEARIVVFHGHPKPEEAMKGRGNAWYRPAQPAGWIRENWRDVESPAQSLAPQGSPELLLS